MLDGRPALVSVLPDVGSELPTVSDAAAVVFAAPVDEAGDGALDVVECWTIVSPQWAHDVGMTSNIRWNVVTTS